MAVNVDDGKLRAGDRMLGDDERRGRPVIDNRWRRKLRRLARADAHERRPWGALLTGFHGHATAAAAAAASTGRALRDDSGADHEGGEDEEQCASHHLFYGERLYRCPPHSRRYNLRQSNMSLAPGPRLGRDGRGVSRARYAARP